MSCTEAEQYYPMLTTPEAELSDGAVLDYLYE
jgi:hypothetical protein